MGTRGPIRIAVMAEAAWLVSFLAGSGCVVRPAATVEPAASGKAAAPAATPPESPPPALRAGEVPAGGLQLAWTSDTHAWNRIVAIAPSGDVISVGSDKINVHARDTGKILESAETCFVRSRRALAFVAPDRAVLACTDGLMEVTVPGLETRFVTKTDGLATAAAVSTKAAAYSLRGGLVNVLSTDGYAPTDRFSAGGDVEELAFSPDGETLAVGRRDGRVLLRALDTQELRDLGAGERRATGLAFAPDGKTLFVSNEMQGAQLLDTADGALLRKYRAGPWLSAAAALGDGWFAATGSDGLVIYRPDTEAGKPVVAGPEGPSASCEGLDVSADGMMLCTGDREGRIACFTTRALRPTSYVARGRNASLAATSQPTGQLLSVEGTIETVSEDDVTIRLQSSGELKTGVEANLFRRMDAAGWLFVGRFVISQVRGATVSGTMKVLRHPMRMRGRQVQAGLRVKVEWHEARAAGGASGRTGR